MLRRGRGCKNLRYLLEMRVQFLRRQANSCGEPNFLSPCKLAKLVDDFLHQGEGAARQPRFGALTKREREILKLLP